MNLAARARTPELMDQPCDYETFRACLADLAQVNRLTLAYGPTLGFLERLRREGCWPASGPLRILDAGSGYGDTLRRIGDWAQARGLAVELTGIDLNPDAARAAAEAGPARGTVRWVTGDALAYAGEADVIVSALFTHHLDDDGVVRFLRRMEAQARIGWFVNDLHRLAFPYHGFRLLAGLMRWHPFVRHDGPVSIARAFRPADWRDLARRAGLAPGQAEIARRFPFRLCVARVKP